MSICASVCTHLNRIGKYSLNINTWCLAGTHSSSQTRIYIYTRDGGSAAAAMNLAPSRFRGVCQVDRFPARKLQPDNETNFSYAACLFPALWAMRRGSSGSSVPPVVLDHVGQLDDEFALLVLLTTFEGMLLMERRRGREREKQKRSRERACGHLKVKIC